MSSSSSLSQSRASDFGLKDQKLIDLLEHHQANYKFKKFSPAVAWDLGLVLRETFVARYGDEALGKKPMDGVPAGQGAIITIKTLTDHTLFACAVGNPSASGPGNWVWAARKEKVVKATGKSSLLVGRGYAIKDRDPASGGFPFPEFACHGGGVPIYLENNEAGPAGIVLVSGLAQLEDHQLIIDGFHRFLPTLQ